jgi:hypothetical protein
MSGELRPLAIPGGDSQILPVRDEGDVKSSLLFVGKLADLVGFNPVARASVMTAVSELASNILKYAGRGQLRAVAKGESRWSPKTTVLAFPMSSWPCATISASRAPWASVFPVPGA